MVTARAVPGQDNTTWCTCAIKAFLVMVWMSLNQEKKVDFSRAQFGTQETTSAEAAMKEMFEQLEALLNLYGSRRPVLSC